MSEPKRENDKDRKRLRRRRDNWSPLLAMAEGYEEKTLVAC